MDSVTLFLSSFVSVLLFGFQSQVVRDKHKAVAFCNSVMIGITQLYIYKNVPSASFMESTFFILGGACGVVASIELHNLFLKYYPKK